jgi:hypothetical protein
MAKIGVKIGLTLRLTKENDFQFIRPEIEISDIDTDGDVKDQLEDVRLAMSPLWAEALDQINNRVMAEMPTITKDTGAAVAKQLAAFKKYVEDELALLNNRIVKTEVK